MQSQQRTFAIEVHVHEHDLPNFQTEVHTTAHVWGGRHVFLLSDPAQLPVIRQLWHYFMEEVYHAPLGMEIFEQPCPDLLH